MQTVMETLALKPTQLAIGMAEVAGKVAELQKLSKKQRQAYLKSNPIPVVLSPHGEAFIVDHHHLTFACYLLNVPKVFIKPKKDFSKSKMSDASFWKYMKQHHLTYLYDQFGDGPRDPLYLPQDVRGMADDPYRSLAWVTRELGGFKATRIPFGDFQWANFFRGKKLIDPLSRENFVTSIRKAMNLARSPETENLPGHLS